MWGMKVIVPTKLQNRVLAELHTSHPGIVKMKSLARTHVCWPGIDREIEDLVRGCPSCQSLGNKPPVMTLHPWNWPTRPWQRVHVDFAGPFFGRMFLIVVDANSKWPEVVPMSTTTAEKTIEELRKLFAAHGLPEQLVSDSGAQFTSQEFEEFLKANSIKHIRSAPYHPATNGEAERFVQTFKLAMKAAKSDESTLEIKPARFLLMYRNTPNTTTGVSPAELLLHRRIRTRLDLLRPSLSSRVLTKQADQKSQHERQSKERQFEPDQSVLVENHKGDPKWVPGIIQEKLGRTSYRVSVGDKIWRRHADQILEFRPQTETNTDIDVFGGLPTPTAVSGDPTPNAHATPPDRASGPRYPARARQPPDRLDPSSN